jgi:hypothetical protein
MWAADLNDLALLVNRIPRRRAGAGLPLEAGKQVHMYLLALMLACSNACLLA